MSRLYDPIRQISVKATPEEFVRQRVLRLLLEELAFPSRLIGVERHLRSFARGSEVVPDRRLDVICYAPAPEVGLAPLLLIECKASKITKKAKEQILGYNHYVRAPYVAIASEEQLMTGWFNAQEKAYCFSSGLPSYQSAMKAVSYGNLPHQ